MEKVVVERLKTLNEIVEALKRGDSLVLKKISNQYIHLAGVEQDANHISVAVITYALSKIFEREDRKNLQHLVKGILKKLKLLPPILEKHDVKAFGEVIADVNQMISSFSGKYKYYVKEIFEKSSINKAAKLYETGVSLERASKMLNISRWDLANYAGQKKVCGDCPSKFGVKQRIKFVRDIFE